MFYSILFVIFTILIDYVRVLIDYTMFLYVYWFLSFCFNQLLSMFLWFYGLKFSILIDYYFVLINYLLWFMASFGFAFYFNQLLYVLIDYKGLKGSFSVIFNRLHRVLIDYLYQILVFGWNNDQFNRLPCKFNRLLTCFLCVVICYTFSSSPHQPPLSLHLLLPPTSTN